MYLTGITDIGNGATTVVVTFTQAFLTKPAAEGAVINDSADGTKNVISAMPVSWTLDVDNHYTGVTFKLSGATNTANYKLQWQAYTDDGTLPQARRGVSAGGLRDCGALGALADFAIPIQVGKDLKALKPTSLWASIPGVTAPPAGALQSAPAARTMSFAVNDGWFYVGSGGRWARVALDTSRNWSQASWYVPFREGVLTCEPDGDVVEFSHTYDQAFTGTEKLLTQVQVVNTEAPYAHVTANVTEQTSSGFKVKLSAPPAAAVEVYYLTRQVGATERTSTGLPDFSGLEALIAAEAAAREAADTTLQSNINGKASLSGAVFNGGTVTVDTPTLKLLQTWNAGAVTFKGLVIECTRTSASDSSAELEIRNHEHPAHSSLLMRTVTGYDNPYGSQRIPSIQAGDSGQIINIGHSNGWVVFGATSAGNSIAALRYDQFNFRRDLKIGWSGTNPGDAFLDAAWSYMDTCIKRGAAATLQMGENHATTPTAQTFKAHDVVSGTGATLTIRPGEGSSSNGQLILGTTSDPVGFHGAASFQATRVSTTATHIPGTAAAVTEDSTWNGYTLGVIVQALISKGVLEA